jgi:hypothetical protein
MSVCPAVCASRDTTCVMLRPTPTNQVANAFPGACIMALSVLPLFLGSGAERALVLLGIPGLVLAVRGYRVSAEARQGELVVHGYLRSRAIPRSAIVDVTDSSSVIWTDGKGRKRRTPILAFSTQPGMLNSVAQHHAECRARLQRWARGQ